MPEFVVGIHVLPPFDSGFVVDQPSEDAYNSAVPIDDQYEAKILWQEW
jgi:hypothetical protein